MRVDAPSLRGMDLRGRCLRSADLRGHSPLGALWVFCSSTTMMWLMLAVIDALNLPGHRHSSPIERVLMSLMVGAWSVPLALMVPGLARPMVATTAVTVLVFCGAALVAAGVLGFISAWSVLAGLPLVLMGVFILPRLSRSLLAGFRAGLDLRESDFTDADLTAANLARANLAGATLDRSVLSHASLYGAGLERTRMRGTMLEYSDLSLCRIESADLGGASLRKVQAYNLRLKHSDLHGCDLSGAILRDARLEEVDLREADLSGADLRGCRLERVQLEDARYSTKTRFPRGFNPTDAGMRLSGSD